MWRQKKKKMRNFSGTGLAIENALLNDIVIYYTVEDDVQERKRSGIFRTAPGYLGTAVSGRAYSV